QITVVTNVVQASGFSVANGQFTNAFAQAVATVIPASVSCSKQYSIDGGPLTNNATITDGATHRVVWYVTVHNTGLANLLNVSVKDLDSQCSANKTIARLDAGAFSAAIPLCTNASFSCTNGTVSDTVNIFANQFDYTSNHIAVCSLNATATASTNVS